MERRRLLAFYPEGKPSMFNDDLIAYLQPIGNQFRPHEWRDVCGGIADIRVEPHRLTLRTSLPPGLYRGRIETRPGAFDMRTAMVDMIRVPDGKAVPVGPWDLNHVATPKYMAIPMARTYVNGKLKGGLWFDMPGPEQIAQQRLAADFGFEAKAGATELVLEFVERDRARMDWGRMAFMELRRDDRCPCPLLPVSKDHPRVYVTAAELETQRRRLLSAPAFHQRVEKFKNTDLGFGVETAGELDLACLAYLLTGDKPIGEKVKRQIVDLCALASWSGQGHSQGQSDNPLLMGGDNDRGIGYRLYYAGVAWDYLRALFNSQERRVVLAKVEEYLQKMYDFTLLQRAYMGCPTADPHSLGAWNGVGIACMAFYDDLPIARQALPFFHGLFCESLKLFPPGGKAAWATFFPFHLVRYLAAAHTFGGPRPELNNSPFLDHLGQALLACFETPNTQELQRGRRTREHRYLTAFLCRFHPTPGIASIYQAFVEQEKKTAGEVEVGLFDLLYAPEIPAKPAAFPTEPFFAQDIGDLIWTARGKKTVGYACSAGLKAGRRQSFHLKPHNREFAMPMASLEVSVDGTPVLINVNIGTYGLNSALTNTMCFEDGGMLTQGQYLNGDIGPEKSAYIRRCLITDRFIYAHAVITDCLHPKFQVRRAERIVVADYRHGTVVIADSFEGAKPIRFATHLHCSGSVKELGPNSYRLTGGQANLIAGIKGGSKGLGDEENGEIFITLLDRRNDCRVLVEEPQWIPGYIYGLNDGRNVDVKKAKFPHYRRWRWEITQPVTSGSFLFALTSEAGEVTQHQERIRLPGQAWLQLTAGKPVQAMGCRTVAEAILVDESAGCLMLLGASELAAGSRKMQFAVPVDVELQIAGDMVRGLCYAPTADAVTTAAGFDVRKSQYGEYNPRSHCAYSMRFESVSHWA